MKRETGLWPTALRGTLPIDTCVKLDADPPGAAKP